VALAAVHALWSLFQWSQLVLARRGGDHFCGLGEPGSCATVWDLPIATAIQTWTGVPVAGWGVVWSAVAFALPLWALVRRARARPIEPAWSGVLLTVLSGIVSVVVLAAASLGSSEICGTCVITYALVLAYAAICLRATERLRPAQIGRGALLVACATAVAFLALLYPGLHTPRSNAAERAALLEEAKRAIETEERPVELAEKSIGTEEKSAEVPKATVETEEESAEAPKSAVETEEESTELPKSAVETEEESAELPKSAVEMEEKSAEVAEESADTEEKPVELAMRSIEKEERPVETELRPDAARLDEVISRLSPQLRQGLSDALAAYAKGDRVPLRPARRLIGPSNAPVRITEFTDILCSHCADLHEVLEVLREMAPSESFALEPRHFPLDAECNPVVEKRSEDGVSCLAARAMICVEKDWLSFANALFEIQRWLTREKIYELASPFMSRERLEACVTSRETEAKLRDDIAWALQHEIQGTPLLLVNGREVPPSLHFLYSMVLAGADPEHPAFAVLPPPQPQARLH
jgi:protein-disulfide isomerase